MRKPSFLITAILLIVSINLLVSAMTGMIMKIDIFNMNDSSGMQFLLFPMLAGLIIFCFVYVNRIAGLISALLLSIGFSLFLNMKLGNSFAFIIAYPVYSLLMYVTLIYIWNMINQNTIRNLAFSVVNGAFYCLVFGIIQYYQDGELSALEFTGLFKFGFVVILLAAISFTVCEMLLNQLDLMFGWDIYTDDDEDEDYEDDV